MKFCYFMEFFAFLEGIMKILQRFRLFCRDFWRFLVIEMKKTGHLKYNCNTY